MVHVDSQFVQLKVKGWFIDTDFNPKLLATKVGRIQALPVTMTAPYVYDIPLNVGDTVLFNHNVCQKKNKVAENSFLCGYHAMFAKVSKDRVSPLEDIMFCEPVVEPDKNIGGFVIKGKVSPVVARVVELSTQCLKAGIRKGDLIFFTKDADYPIDVLGRHLYAMRIRNVKGIERDGKLRTFRDKLLVKNVTELGSIGGVERIYAKSNLQTGVVMEQGATTIQAGTTLTYLNGVASIVRWNEQDYAFLDERHVKLIMNNDMESLVKGTPGQDRILIKQDDDRSEVAGFEIPESEKKKPHRGVVVAVGPGGRDSNGNLIPMTAKVGDRVAYSKYATTPLEVEGVEYILIKEGDLEYIF